jgi:Phospholipase_D-nuclease N-terminal
MLKVLVYAFPLILGVYALVDCIQTADKDVSGLPKLGWLAVIVLLPIIGPAAWLIAGRASSRATSGLRWPAGPASAQRPARRMVAPDDDPEFLRQLNRDTERRRHEDEARRAKPVDPAPDAPDEGEPGNGATPLP